MVLSKKYGFVCILVSALIAWGIANVGVPTGNLEMAAIANYFGPPIVGIVSLLLFAIIDYFFKKPRLIVVLILVLINVAVGISIRIISNSIGP